MSPRKTKESLPEIHAEASIKYVLLFVYNCSNIATLHCLCLSGSEDGGEDVAEDAREKLNSLLEKYGRDSNDFDLGDLQDDFDDLDVNSDSEDEDSE